MDKIINNAKLLETPTDLKSSERLSNGSFKNFKFWKPTVENKTKMPSNHFND